MEYKYLLEDRNLNEAVRVNNGDVVSIQYLPNDWLKRLDVMPSKSEQPPQFNLQKLAVKDTRTSQLQNKGGYQ